MTQTRDSHGRFKADHRTRNIAIGATAAIGAIASAIGAALHLGVFDRFFPNGAEHEAPDLALDRHRPGPDDRAPDAFRPDATAPVPDSMRESLRPAAWSSPRMAEDRGSMRSQTAPAN